jgi:hypothetical protein
LKGNAWSTFVFRIAVNERIVISFPGRRESILGAFEQIIRDLHAPERNKRPACDAHDKIR